MPWLWDSEKSLIQSLSKGVQALFCRFVRMLGTGCARWVGRLKAERMLFGAVWLGVYASGGDELDEL